MRNQRKRYVVGRGEEVHIRIEDDTVSSEHLAIEEIDKHQVRLIDLNSTNHTFLVNRIGRTRIQNEVIDRHRPIQLGDYRTTPDKLLSMIQSSDSGRSKRGEDGRWTQL